MCVDFRVGLAGVDCDSILNQICPCNLQTNRPLHTHSLLWRQGAMSLHHIYIAVTLQAVCNSVQLPAFMASLSLLLAGREQELVKLNSVSQALSGVAMLLAPTISSTLLKTQGSLAWVFAFDLSTLLLAVLVMLATRIPSPPAHQHPQYQGLLAAERQHSAGSTSSTGSWGSGGGDSGKPTAVATATYSPSQQQQQQQQLAQSAGAIVRKLWRDTVEAWRFLRAHGGLYALLLVVAQIQLSNGAFQILSTPIILSFAEPAAIAGVLTVSGVGAMLGFALPIALKGANAHRARTVLACVLAQGLLLLLLVVPRLPVVLGVAFGYMLLVPLSRSCREALWMQKVPVDMQGRVFSLQHSIAKAALPVAAVLAGPLVDRLLQPLVDSVPALAALCGAAPNDGAHGGARGRGSALLALLLGAANVGCAAAAFAYPPYRALDETPPAGEAWQHRE